MKQGYVYIMTNKANNVFYTGVTNDLKLRAGQHKNKLVEGFTKKYNLTKLAYYDIYDTILDTIAREKQIKAGSRNKKLLLIESMNLEFKDLSDEL